MSSRQPVTIEGPGVPVVFHEFASGQWCAIIYPGPSGFGDTPQEALHAAMTSWPDAFADAIKARGTPMINHPEGTILVHPTNSSRGIRIARDPRMCSFVTIANGQVVFGVDNYIGVPPEYADAKPLPG